MINWNLRNKKSTTLLVSRFLSHPQDISVPRNAFWETPVQHVFVRACSTKQSAINENRVVLLQSVGRTDRHDKANGIFSRLLCKTHVKIFTSICNFIWHPPPKTPSVFLPIASVSLSDHVIRAQCRQKIATWLQHISRLCQSSLRCVAFFFFYSPAMLHICYWRNS